jgi:hypothetical protein
MVGHVPHIKSRDHNKTIDRKLSEAIHQVETYYRRPVATKANCLKCQFGNYVDWQNLFLHNPIRIAVNNEEIVFTVTDGLLVEGKLIFNYEPTSREYSIEHTKRDIDFYPRRYSDRMINNLACQSILVF